MDACLESNPLILSTGMFRRVFEKEYNYINLILEFYAKHLSIEEIDGVELNVRSPKLFSELDLSERALNFAAKLKHNTLHYFYLDPVDFSEGATVSRQELDFIEKIMTLHGAFDFKAVVLHPFKYSPEELNAMHLLFNEDVGISVFCFESMLREQDVAVTDFEALFIDQRFRMLLDAAHAAAAQTSASAYSFEYLEPYFERVEYLHLSSVRRDLAYYDDTGFFCPSKGHSLFCETQDEDLKLFDPVLDLLDKKHFLAVILEQGFVKADIDLLRHELDFVRKYFLERNGEYKH